VGEALQGLSANLYEWMNEVDLLDHRRARRARRAVILDGLEVVATIWSGQLRPAAVLRSHS
jgi:hypothetical protein